MSYSKTLFITGMLLTGLSLTTPHAYSMNRRQSINPNTWHTDFGNIKIPATQIRILGALRDNLATVDFKTTLVILTTFKESKKPEVQEQLLKVLGGLIHKDRFYDMTFEVAQVVAKNCLNSQDPKMQKNVWLDLLTPLTLMNNKEVCTFLQEVVQQYEFPKDPEILVKCIELVQSIGLKAQELDIKEYPQLLCQVVHKHRDNMDQDVEYSIMDALISWIENCREEGIDVDAEIYEYAQDVAYDYLLNCKQSLITVKDGEMTTEEVYEAIKENALDLLKLTLNSPNRELKKGTEELLAFFDQQ